MRRSALLATGFLAALLAAACAGGPAPPAQAPDLPVMDVSDLSERALLLMLADRRLFEPVTVERASSGGPELRAQLAVTLGRVGDRRGRVDLQSLLLDRVPEVRRAAAFGLGELGDPESERGLLGAVTDPDRETGTLAVEALGKLGTSVVDVGDALASLPDEERWARLLPSLFRFDEEAMVPLAEAGLGVSDPQLHAMAVYALARKPRPEAAADFRRLLGDGDPRVRAWAAQGLGAVGDGGDLVRLAPLLAAPQAGPVIQALHAGQKLVDAGKAAAPAEWRRPLLDLFDDPRPHVRIAALEAASAWLLDDELGAALAQRAGTEEKGRRQERATALVALAAGADPRAAELVSTASRDDDGAIRAAAARAAASLGAVKLLDRLARDPDPRPRAAALQGLLATSPDPAKVATEALNDTDPGIKATLFTWLTGHPEVPIEQLGEAVVFALRDRNIESSLDGVEALLARARAEPLERGTIVALLEKLAEFPDYLVRRRAIAALGELGRPQPKLGAVQDPRGVDAFESVVRRTSHPRMVEVHTSRGDLEIRLACPQAPLTCLNFLTLARNHFYDGLTFHRVVPDFVVQGGDPRADGYGGPGYTIRDEINRLRYRRGVVGMALAGPDTGGSQFFITLSPQPRLDGGYTAFGEVVGGDEVLDQLVEGDRILSVVERP